MNDIKDYAASIAFSAEEMAELPEEIRQHKIDCMEKDAVWKAIKQAGERWICIKASTECVKPYGKFGDYTEYRIRIHCRDVVRVEKTK